MADQVPAASLALDPAVEQSTTPIPVGYDAPEARFAFVVAPDQDPVAEADRLRAALSRYDVVVRPLSPLDPDALSVRFLRRTFVDDYASVFAATYAMTDAFGFAEGEPDIHAPVYPIPVDPGRLPQIENIESFTAGCWVGPDSALDDKFEWALEAIHVPAAWAYSRSRNRPEMGESIIVAQPDTGVTDHLELRSVKTLAGYDFLAGRPGATDPLGYAGNPGHGTSTASVLVSAGTTGRVTGTAPRATHLPIRAIDSVVRIGLVAQVTVSEAIDYAVREGAHVISMSLGGNWSVSLRRALLRAVDADVIVLAAAGNCVGIVAWPAAYDDCIAVAGINREGKPWKGSSSGPAVDIAAPGENVYRASADGDGSATDEVGQGEGTSYAVAMTAGVAALWLAHHGRANLVAAARARGETLQAMFRRLLKATAYHPESGWGGPGYGAGIVHARRLLEAPLDLGAGVIETTAPAPIRDADRELQRFVEEATDAPSVPHGPFAWPRYGAELSLVLLQQRLAQEPGSAFLETTAPDRHTRVSTALAEALDDAGITGVGTD